MKRFVHALGSAFLTILVMILIVYGWAFIQMKLMLKSQPELFGYSFFLQPLDDMMPDIDQNVVVLVQKGSPYKVGDSILYFDIIDSLYKLHYVVGYDDATVTTKSSISSENNEPVSTNNIVGKAVRKVAFFGAIVTFFKQKVVLITIGIVGITFLIISQYMEYKPKKKDQNTN